MNSKCSNLWLLKRSDKVKNAKCLQGYLGQRTFIAIKQGFSLRSKRQTGYVAIPGSTPGLVFDECPSKCHLDERLPNCRFDECSSRTSCPQGRNLYDNQARFLPSVETTRCMCCRSRKYTGTGVRRSPINMSSRRAPSKLSFRQAPSKLSSRRAPFEERSFTTARQGFSLRSKRQTVCVVVPGSTPGQVFDERSSRRNLHHNQARFFALLETTSSINCHCRKYTGTGVRRVLSEEKPSPQPGKVSPFGRNDKTKRKRQIEMTGSKSARYNLRFF